MNNFVREESNGILAMSFRYNKIRVWRVVLSHSFVNILEEIKRERVQFLYDLN